MIKLPLKAVAVLGNAFPEKMNDKIYLFVTVFINNNKTAINFWTVHN